MVEMRHPFGGYVKEYGLARSEGLLLRYLSEVYKTLVQTIPEPARTPELDDVTRYLGRPDRHVRRGDVERLRAAPLYVARSRRDPVPRNGNPCPPM